MSGERRGDEVAAAAGARRGGGICRQDVVAGVRDP